jgi:hypothetical protein
MAADLRLRPRGHRDRHVSCFQCEAVLILMCGTSLCVLCGTSLCVLIRTQNNLAQGTAFLHWQSALFTNKQAVSTGPNIVRWFHTTGLTQYLKYSQIFPPPPQNSEAPFNGTDCDTLSLALISDVILFSQGRTAVQSTNCSGPTLEESYLDSE